MRLDERIAPSGLSAFEVLIDTQGTANTQTAPLFFSPRMWERILGELPIATGWHITDSDNLDTVLKYRHRQNTISVAVRPTSDLLRGLQTDGGIAIKLSGQKIFGSMKDFFSHRLKDGQKVKRRDLPKPITEALNAVWVDVIAWGLEQYLALRDDWDDQVRKTLQSTITGVREPQTAVTLATKNIRIGGMVRGLGSVLRGFFREPYDINLTDEEKKQVGRIKQQMIARYIAGQEKAIIPYIHELTDMGYDRTWDETLLTNYEVLRCIIYGGDTEQRTQVMNTLDRQKIPYSIIEEDSQDFGARLANVARTGDEAALDDRNQKILAQMKEGIGSALAGTVGGMISGALTGRGAGQRAAQQIIGPQPTQAQIPPKPSYMPTNNAPQPQPSRPQVPSSRLGSQFKKAVKGTAQNLINRINGGDQNAQNTIKQFAGGGPSAQLQNQDPQRAAEYVDKLIAFLGVIARMNPSEKQGESRSASANLDIDSNIRNFQQRYIEKTDIGTMVNAAKQLISTIGGKTADKLSDQELQSLQTLINAFMDPQIKKQLIKKASNDKGTLDLLNSITPENIKALPQAIQTLIQSREKTATAAATDAQKVQITRQMKPTKLNGAIANAMRSIGSSQRQSFINDVRLIIMKYGQVEDFTQYTWADIETIVEILEEYGAAISIGPDITNMRNKAKLTPSSKPAAVKQGQPTEQSQPTPQQSVQQQGLDFGQSNQQEGEIGQIVSAVQRDPAFLTKIIKKYLQDPQAAAVLKQKAGITK